MKDRSTIPKWGQALLGTVLLTLALTAGGISLAVNCAYGLQASLLQGVTYALGDCVKMALPITAQGLRGWDPFRRLLWIGAIIFSVWTACGYFSAYEGSKIAEAKQIDQERGEIRTRINRLETRLQAITVTDSPGALDALAKAQETRAKDEAKTGLGSKYDEAMKKAGKLRAQAARARQRDKIATELARAYEELQAKKIIPLGTADNIAALTGGERTEIARLDSLIRTLATIALLEAVAALAGYGAALLGPLISAPARWKREKKAEPAPATGREPAARAKLRLILENSDHSEIRRSQRSLSELLNVKRSTLNGYLQKWHAEGWIQIQTTGGITSIRLMRAA